MLKRQCDMYRPVTHLPMPPGPGGIRGVVFMEPTFGGPIYRKDIFAGYGASLGPEQNAMQVAYESELLKAVYDITRQYVTDSFREKEEKDGYVFSERKCGAGLHEMQVSVVVQVGNEPSPPAGCTAVVVW